MWESGTTTSNITVWKVFCEDRYLDTDMSAMKDPPIQHCSGSWQKKKHFLRQKWTWQVQETTEKFIELHPCEWGRKMTEGGSQRPGNKKAFIPLKCLHFILKSHCRVLNRE